MSLSSFSSVPVKIVGDLKPLTITERETAVLTCEVSNTKAEVTWLKDGEPIDITLDKYEVLDEGRRKKLRIKNISPEDAAEYTCQLPRSSSTMTLTVNGKLITVNACHFIVEYTISDLFFYVYMLSPKLRRSISSRLYFPTSISMSFTN